jgi:serine/threonine protein kinase
MALLADVAAGLAALHERAIVHRDLKPHNVLITDSGRAKLSDMGLSKQLVPEQSSFESHGAGERAARAGGAKSVGALGGTCAGRAWREASIAPCRRPSRAQCILRNAARPGFQHTPHSPQLALSPTRPLPRPHLPAGGSSGWQAPEQLIARSGGTVRQTRSMDIFSLGCVMHYTLTGGQHPFGGNFERDTNIMRGQPNLSALAHSPEAVNLVAAMLSKNPSVRPTMAGVLAHPFWWGVEQRLQFLVDVSDRWAPGEGAGRGAGYQGGDESLNATCRAPPHAAPAWAPCPGQSKPSRARLHAALPCRPAPLPGWSLRIASPTRRC